jgi:cell division protein FtsZ
VGQVNNPELGDALVVTVIATGFEREEQPARMVEKASDVAQPALASARTGLGADGEKDLERPTFLRRLTTRHTQERLGFAPEDDWDVPTFLRKKPD